MTRDRAQCEFYHLPTVSERDKREELAVVYASEGGNNALKVGTAEPRSGAGGAGAEVRRSLRRPLPLPSRPVMRDPYRALHPTGVVTGQPR